MDFIYDMFHNTLFLSAIIGWTTAQVLKTLLYLFLNKEFVAERLVGSGGMPSSHSATVCALATAVGLQYGASGFEFTITLLFAIVVMYDAIGVRRETGIQAKVLNEMIELFTNMGSDMKATDKLKEFVGHTPLQVLAGAIIGILAALLVCTS